MHSTLRTNLKSRCSRKVSDWCTVYLVRINTSGFDLNYDCLVDLLKNSRANSDPTWGDRLCKGETRLLPVSVPLNEHWMLVYLRKVGTKVYIRVLDSMHSTFHRLHVPLTDCLTRLCYLMGGLDDLDVISITGSEVIPLEQWHILNFCGYHVIARVWMFSTGQVKKQLRHCDVDVIQKFIQFMVLSKEMRAVDRIRWQGWITWRWVCLRLK